MSDYRSMILDYTGVGLERFQCIVFSRYGTPYCKHNNNVLYCV